MPRRVLALEITDADVKAAALETTFRDHRVTGLYQQPLSAASGSKGEQIRRFLDQHELDGDTVLSALPGDCVTWRTFFLPFRDRKRLAQTIPFELEGQVPFGLDESVVDYQIIRRDRSGTSVLAALVRKQDLERHLELLQTAGLDPKVVDIAPLAALNILSLVPDLPPTFAFVDVGVLHVTVALFRNGELAGLRALARRDREAVSDGSGAEVPSSPADTTEHPPGGPATAALANGGDRLSPLHQVLGPSSLVADVRWTLLALNGAPLDEQLPCYAAGERAGLGALERDLTETLGLRISRLDRVRLRNLASATDGQAPAFASSLGLALREVAPSNAIGLNFRRGEFTYHQSEQELRRSLRVVAALAALVVALTVADLYVGYRQLALRVTALDGQIRKVVAATLPDVAITQPRAQLQDEIDVLQQRLDLLHSVVPSTNSTSVDILRAVSGAIPNKIRVDSDEWSLEPDAIRMRGNTDTFESVDAIKQQLLGTGVFSDVEVKDVRAAKDGAGVDFRLRLVFSKELRPRGGQP